MHSGDYSCYTSLYSSTLDFLPPFLIAMQCMHYIRQAITGGHVPTVDLPRPTRVIYVTHSAISFTTGASAMSVAHELAGYRLDLDAIPSNMKDSQAAFKECVCHL